MKPALLILLLVDTWVNNGFCFQMEVNTLRLTHFLDDYVNKELGSEEFQDYLNSLSIRQTNETPDTDIIKLTQRFRDIIESRQKALFDLRLAVQKSFKSLNPTAIGCCIHESDYKYDFRFRKKVSFDRMCFVTSPLLANQPIHLTNEFMRAAAVNMKLIPSLKWQYFTSNAGITTFYPAPMEDHCHNYDGRLRSWYKDTSTLTPKRFVILLDNSGSMSKMYMQHSKLDLAKEAAFVLISSMSSSDRFGILTASFPILTINSTNENSECFASTLAVRSQANHQAAKRFLNNLKAEGGSYFVGSIVSAFNYFTSSEEYLRNNHTLKEGVEYMLIIISDGYPSEDADSINDIINHQLSRLNFAVRVITISPGDSVPSVMKSWATINKLKPGQSIALENVNHIQHQLASFFKAYDHDKTYSADIPFWHLPYNDAFGIGEVFTCSLPVVVNKTFIGVVGIDVALEDIITQLNYSSPDEYSYIFFSNNKGYIIHHPIFPLTENSRQILLFYYERSNALKNVFHSKILKGVNGSVSDPVAFHSTVSGGTMAYGSQEIRIYKRYLWNHIPGMPFVFFLVASNLEHSSFVVPGHPPAGSIQSHLFNITPPVHICQHFGLISSQNVSSLFLPPSAFVDSSLHYNYHVNYTSLKSIIRELEGGTVDHVHIKADFKDDVTITHHAQELWLSKQGVSADTQSDVHFRYISTFRGVFRIYPGIDVGHNYDPLSKAWYRQISGNKVDRYIVATPYVDAFSKTPVMTIGRPLFIYSNVSSERKIYGVIAMDIILARFNELVWELYPLCAVTHRYRCYLFDMGGFVYAVSYWEYSAFLVANKDGKENWRKHIIDLEPEIALNLIENSIMVNINCMNRQAATLAYAYQILGHSLPTDGYFGSVVSNFFDSYSFRVLPVQSVNLVLVVRSLSVVDCHPSNFACYCNPQQCHHPRIKDADKCQCPCSVYTPGYNPCQGRFESEDIQFTACITFKSTAHIDISTEYLLNSRSSYPQCYYVHKQEEPIYSDESYVAILWMIVFSIWVSFMMWLFIWWKRDEIANSQSQVDTNWNKDSASYLKKASISSLQQTMLRKIMRERDRSVDDQNTSTRTFSRFTEIKSELSSVVAKVKSAFGFGSAPQPNVSTVTTSRNLSRSPAEKRLIQHIVRNVKGYMVRDTKAKKPDDQPYSMEDSSQQDTATISTSVYLPAVTEITSPESK